MLGKGGKGRVRGRICFFKTKETLGYLNKKDSVKILMLKYRREMITVEVPKETQGDESLVSGRGVSLRGRWAQV